jgi:xanthine dehydrogenase YagS FAD-binding subunit
VRPLTLKVNDTAVAAEAAITGRALTQGNIEQAAAAALAEAKPMTMNAYKVALTRGLLVRAL